MTTDSDGVAVPDWPYNTVQLTHGRIMSTRDGLNVMDLLGSDRRVPCQDTLNVRFRRPRAGKREEDMRAAVRETLELIGVKWLHRIGGITFRQDHNVRGLYHYNVWSTPTKVENRPVSSSVRMVTP